MDKRSPVIEYATAQRKPKPLRWWARPNPRAFKWHVLSMIVVVALYGYGASDEYHLDAYLYLLLMAAIQLIALVVATYYAELEDGLWWPLRGSGLRVLMALCPIVLTIALLYRLHAG